LGGQDDWKCLQVVLLPPLLLWFGLTAVMHLPSKSANKCKNMNNNSSHPIAHKEE
jgi:hypothetical protein